MDRCTAQSKQSGERCKNAPSIGRNVCRFHGGKTPRGIDSPRFKSGRYSKAYQTDLRDRYQAALSDPELLSTRAEIAALVLRAEDLIVRARDASKESEIDRAWSQLVTLFTTAAKLREVEFKRLEKLRGFITLEQAQALARMMARSVQDQVASGKQGQVLIDAIGRDIQSFGLMEPGAGGAS